MEKIWRIVAGFLVVLILLTTGIYIWTGNLSSPDDIGKQMVIINEVRQLSKSTDGTSPLEDALVELEDSIRKGSVSENQNVSLKVAMGFLIMGLLYMVMLLFYIWHSILRPFQKLENYAQEVAGGNLDITLDYERRNYFGAFTWAFDHMRKEILAARKKEHEAIEANKTIVASLSHDIKTPIASIRAYSEALEANLGASFEKRQQYSETIIRKCDEVTALVNDLVLHSLSELEKLEIKCEEISAVEVIRNTIRDLEFEKLELKEPLVIANIWGDRKRIAQILENLLNNARKYAPNARVEIFTEVEEGLYLLHVRDHGKGILPEDMPFIMQKFYRGKNVFDMPGSGLGLYIVSYLVEEMGGEVQLNNSEQGLDAIVKFKIVKDNSKKDAYN